MNEEYTGPERRKRNRAVLMEDPHGQIILVLDSMRNEMDAREARFNHRLDVIVEKHRETHDGLSTLKSKQEVMQTELTRWKDGAKIVNYIAIATASLIVGGIKLWDSLRDHVK
jgi:hypothetical protein